MAAAGAAAARGRAAGAARAGARAGARARAGGPRRPRAAARRGGARAAAASPATADPALRWLERPPLPPKAEVYAHIKNFASADGRVATGVFASTMCALFGAYALAHQGLLAGGAAGAMAVAGGLVAGVLLKIRTFMCFHDMAHKSFWPTTSATGRLANRVFGALSGALCYTSFTRWDRIHNNHHRISNDLDENQHAQTAPWSTRERAEKTQATRNLFDAKYNQWVQWVVGPWFVFFVVNRKCPPLENLLWAAPLAACYAVGGAKLLAFEFAVSYVTAFLGMCLFHAQHTFDGVYKRRKDEWDYYENGMLGSSMLLIPEALKPFTLGIEYHHIHHLSVGVPSYKLRACHEAGDEKGLWDAVPTLPLSSIPATMPYAVWDEDDQKFLSVPESRARD